MQNRILTIYGVAILLGMLTGIFGSCLQLFIQYLDVQIISVQQFFLLHQLNPAWATIGIAVLFVTIAHVLVTRIAPEAAGSGIQEIEGVLLHQRPIYWRRLLPVKFIGASLAIAAKMVVGREGPTIQIGGNLGEALGELFNFSAEKRDTFIAAGSAAGLASAFNAPLAGVLFVLEEMRNQFNFTFTNLKTVAICCAIATVTLHFIIGPQAAIPMPIFQLPSFRSLFLFFLLGLIVGLAGLLFNKTLMASLALTDLFGFWQKRIYLLLIAILIGSVAAVHPNFVGGGYMIIENAISFSPSFNLLLWMLVIRFILTMCCYSTGVPGGVFAPMLALGTLLGLAASQILSHLMPDQTIHPGMFAVAGMGGLFAAAVRAPITGILLVVEMTQNYSLILPMMITCLTSTTVLQLVGNPPIYTQLLDRSLKRRE